MNKKIGILTFCKSNNSGTMLQLYGLYCVLNESNKTEVMNFDCKKTYIWQRPKLTKREILEFKFIGRMINDYVYKKFRKKMLLSNNVSYANKSKFNNIYDFVFVGSDQVLNAEISDWCPTYINYDNIIATYGVYGYGLSFGYYVPKTLLEKRILFKGINNFKMISFREEDYKQKLHNGIEYPVVCDPTMLHKPSFWISQIKNKKKYSNKNYIYLYYANEDILNEAIKFAQKNDFLIYYSTSLIKIPKDKRFKKKRDDPINFLNLIYNAKYVFCSSYHGLLFSLYFQKEFYLPTSNDLRNERMRFIINKYKIEDVTKKELIGNLKLNYQNIFKIMERERKKGLEYIEDCLNGKYFK